MQSPGAYIKCNWISRSVGVWQLLWVEPCWPFEDPSVYIDILNKHSRKTACVWSRKCSFDINILEINHELITRWENNHNDVEDEKMLMGEWGK